MATVVGPQPFTYPRKVMRLPLLIALYARLFDHQLGLDSLIQSPPSMIASPLLEISHWENPLNSTLVMFVILSSYQKPSSHLSLILLFILGNSGLLLTP
ncbi:hypothetical protein GBA52_001652 [Prunus armeniaca]|nr:hypothetical protein GBA52_001652 [Prunus armeniaca]